MAALCIRPDRPWLAPLAGYSNLPFRLLCRELGAAAACTEMVSAKGIYYSLYPHASGACAAGSWPGQDAALDGSPPEATDWLEEGQAGRPTLPAPLPSLAEINARKGKGTWALLASPETDTPLIVQLFGAEPDTVRKAAEVVLQVFAGREIYFDLNMGCAVPKVVRTGSGAALLTDPDRAVKVAKALLDATGPGRAGFKLRLGWQNGEDVYLELARRLQDAGAAWVTLHPRYGRQGFGGRADWGRLALLKKALDIPVVASGDLLSAAAAKDCLEQSGADAVMFARGAMHNPFIFKQFRQLMAGGQVQWPEPGALLEAILRHAGLARFWLDERYALSQMRGFIPRYVHHVPGVRALRQQLTACRTWEQLEIIISQLAQHCRETGAFQTPEPEGRSRMNRHSATGD